jgi:hypothetical protein
MTDVIAELMRANLFELFNQRDSMLRRAAIERINPKTSAGPTTASLSGTTRWTLKPLSCKRCSVIFGSWLRDLRSRRLDWVCWHSNLFNQIATTLRTCQVSMSLLCATVSLLSSTPSLRASRDQNADMAALSSTRSTRIHIPRWRAPACEEWIAVISKKSGTCLRLAGTRCDDTTPRRLHFLKSVCGCGDGSSR